MIKFFTLALALCACLSSFARAQSYPVRSIRLVVPLSPGGGTDILARAMGQKLGAIFKQNIVVDNRAGGSGISGTDIVAKAPPNGYTLLMVSSTHTIVPSLIPNLPFDPVADFAPITQATAQPYLLGIHPSVPAHSVKEFIALAKSRPGQFNYASGGNGSAPHVGTELLKMSAGIDIAHVPYKGGAPALAALIAGEISILFSSIASTLPMVNAGKVRALAVSGLKRSPAAPGLPTVAEGGLSGFEIINWYGLMAPAKTPRNIVTRLYGEILNVLHDPEIMERLAKDGTDVVGSSPVEFGQYMKTDIAKWAKVVRRSGIRAE